MLSEFIAWQHEERKEILRAGLEVSSYVNADDTGARHQGKNGYCTHIANDLFAWFESTTSKSRIKFLDLLRAGNTDYVINEHSSSQQRLGERHSRVCQEAQNQRGHAQR